MDKTLEEIQRVTDTWASQFEKPYFSPLSILATIMEECGEVARVMNHLYGDKKIKKSEKLSPLDEVLGDLLFSIVSFTSAFKISLEEIWERKVEKLYGRDNERFQKKESNGHLQTKEGLNYRPIISVTPSKTKVPVDSQDLRNLDNVIQKKLVITANEL